MNQCIFTGRICSDLELKTTTTGKMVCSFSLAVRKRIKPTDGSPDAVFVRCVAWEKQAEYLSRYSKGKGGRLTVVARYETRKYTANDGSERDVHEFVVNEVDVIDFDEDGNQQQQRQPAQRQKAQRAPDPDEYDPFADE